MKKMSVLLMAALCMFSVSSCRKVVGKGPEVTQERSTATFSAIELGVPADMYYTPGSQVRIELTAQQNILDVIETNVSGGKLKIRVRHGVNIRNHESIIVKITAPDINELGVNGSGNIHVLVPHTATRMNLYVNGSGNLEAAEINTSDLEARISGSGDIRVYRGETNDEDLSISGSGSIDLSGVVTDEARTETSGSGTMRVHVLDKLNVKISGSGTVYYKGNPAITSSISGSGKVKPM